MLLTPVLDRVSVFLWWCGNNSRWNFYPHAAFKLALVLARRRSPGGYFLGWPGQVVVGFLVLASDPLSSSEFMVGSCLLVLFFSRFAALVGTCSYFIFVVDPLFSACLFLAVSVAVVLVFLGGFVPVAVTALSSVSGSVVVPVVSVSSVFLAGRFFCGIFWHYQFHFAAVVGP